MQSNNMAYRSAYVTKEGKLALTVYLFQVMKKTNGVGCVFKIYIYNHLVQKILWSQMKLWNTFLKTNWEIRWKVKMHRNLKE